MSDRDLAERVREACAALAAEMALNEAQNYSIEEVAAAIRALDLTPLIAAPTSATAADGWGCGRCGARQERHPTDHVWESPFRSHGVGGSDAV